MKWLNDIAWNVTEPVYREYNALSQSTISKYAREGFNKISSLFDRIETASLTFGSIVDCLVTEPEEFDNRFMVADFPKISDTQKSIVECLFSKDYICSLKEIPDNDLLKAIEQFKYQQNWKPETRIRVIKENCSEYWDMLTLSNGKKVISTEEYNNAVECVTALKTSEATKMWFDDNPFNTDLKGWYQLKFKYEFSNIPVKCMFDRIVVDYKRKIIYPCDLKTSSSMEYEFFKSFMKWNYYIQANMYSWILREILKKDEFFKDFIIDDFRFIVINRYNRNPLIWKYNTMYDANEIILGNEKVKNWPVLIRELDFYLKNNSTVPIGINSDKDNSINEWLNIYKNNHND